MERILIVEDEPGISSFIKLELTHEGYASEIAADGRAALEAFGQGGWDLVLLDIMLPGLNGLEVLRRIRKTSAVPVILVTARDETFDTVTGLDTGADDYITKPFAVEELLARIRSLLRRTAGTENAAAGKKPAALTFRDLTIDTKACTVRVRGESVTLTKTEYQLLLCLVSHKNEALGREKIIDEVWGEEHYIDPNSVDVYVRYLRSKIDSPEEESYITTMRGIGYIMKETPAL